MSHIFLTGFMGSGKSTVGRLVAERLSLPFIDLDIMIEERSGRSIAEVFAALGEEGFRSLEHEALASVVRGEDAVIACGGGVVLRDENRQLLKRHGKVAHLAVSAEEALARIGDAAGRPLLAGDARAMAPRILAARLALYRATADVTVDTVGRTPEEVADEVVRQLRGGRECRVAVRSDPPYEVVLGSGVLELLPRVAEQVAPSKRVAVVTDSDVASLYGDRVSAVLEQAGLATSLIAVPAGERSKSWEQAGALLERFAAAGLDRGSAVIALGGGVVGDLAGFAASVYMRGIPVVQAPTTLLAQVDSAIGGKTGVDLPSGKNLAGTFWQPAAVIADQGVLHTLPDEEWANGLAEVVKTALLAGGALWESVSKRTERLVSRDDGAVASAVEQCVRYKADVVSRDAREASGIRECLNLGHTLGHAIERELGYGTVAHGTAVAEGLRFAVVLSVELVGADPSLRESLAHVLDSLGIPRVPSAQLTEEGLLSAMRADKKARSAAVRFVLLRDPGDWVVEAVPEDVLRAKIREHLSEGGAAA